MTLEPKPTPLPKALNSGKRVLLAEPDPVFAKVLKSIIEESGFQVAIMAAEDLAAQAKVRQPTLILISEDATGSGLNLCVELKSSPYTSSIPVVLLSAQADEEAELLALAQGADAYLTQPASEALLKARIRAVLRPHSPPGEASDTNLQAEGLVLDVRSRKAYVKGVHVALTRKEFDLLAAFLRRRGHVVYTTHLYHTVWGYGESAPVDSHTVKVHVSSLRSKLGPALGKKIVNLPGLGYRFDT